MSPSSIAGINLLPPAEKEAIYRRFIPAALLERFAIRSDLADAEGRSLVTIRCQAGATDVVVDLRHCYGAPDPLLYAHLTDTINGQVHVLLYIVNDPESPRFDVDRMPDGSPTEFGTFRRNLAAEQAAMAAGLAPGQVRRGLRMLQHSIAAFEAFVASLGHNVFFIEPLAYHNAVVFERYGFAYQQGRRLMEAIDAGFRPGGELDLRLDGSSPFRQPGMERSIRGRSWALHDGILGRPFTGVTMYKRVGEEAGVQTFADGTW
ncbi:MAG: hypothetical protein AB1449_02335 [Chloroflexota bacterium]